MKNSFTRRSFLSFVGPSVAGGVVALGLSNRALSQSVQKTSLPTEGARGEVHERGGKVWSQEYWAQKGDIKLCLYRKRTSAPKAGGTALPVLFLVHGSSLSARASFDLTVPGRGEYSLMDKFAGFGYDVWTMDFEGYGKSSAASGNSNIADGVADLKAAIPVVARETGQQRFHVFGESSGGLRAGAYAMAEPERVNRLVLAAFTYTGKGSPTLADRAKQLDYYRAHNRRPRDREMIRSIYTRDKPGTTDPAVGEAVADFELQYGDTVPTGTYLDMTANLPLVDPAKVTMPVILLRGEFDGIATNEDLLDFFGKLPNGDRQFSILPGTAHSVATGVNRADFWHAMHAFLSMPPRVDKFASAERGL
jgi:pimeloyl-ACP methyl ester carboxylesterase